VAAAWRRQQGIKDIRFLSDPTVGDLTIGASIAITEGFICIRHWPSHINVDMISSNISIT